MKYQDVGLNLCNFYFQTYVIFVKFSIRHSYSGKTELTIKQRKFYILVLKSFISFVWLQYITYFYYYYLREPCTA
jgi:hypothetical protein